MGSVDITNTKEENLKLELESVFFLRREKDHPVFEDGLQSAFDYIKKERSKDMAVSLDQIQKLNKLIGLINRRFGCSETSDIFDHLCDLIKKSNLSLPLPSLYFALEQLHKMQ